MSNFEEFQADMANWDPDGDQDLWAAVWYARGEEVATRLFVEDARILLDQCVWRRTDEGYKLEVDEYHVPVTEMYMTVLEGLGSGTTWYDMHVVSLAQDVLRATTDDLHEFVETYGDLATWDPSYKEILSVGHARLISELDERRLWTLLHALYFIGAETPWEMQPSLNGPRISGNLTPRRMDEFVRMDEEALADLNSGKRWDAWCALVKRLGHEPEDDTTLPAEVPYWVKEYRHEIPEEPFARVVDRALPVWSVPKDEYAKRAYSLEERRPIRMATTVNLVTLKPAKWKRCYFRDFIDEVIGLGWEKDKNGKWQRTKKYRSYNDDLFATKDRGVRAATLGVLRFMVETGDCLAQLETKVADGTERFPKTRYVDYYGEGVKRNRVREADRIDPWHVLAFCPRCKGKGGVMRTTRKGKVIFLAPMYEDIHADICTLCGAEIPQMVLNMYVPTMELSMLRHEVRGGDYYLQVQVYGKEVKRAAETSVDLVRVTEKRRFNNPETGKFEWRPVKIEKTVPWYVGGRYPRQMDVRVAHRFGQEDLIQVETTSSWL